MTFIDYIKNNHTDPDTLLGKPFLTFILFVIIVSMVSFFESSHQKSIKQIELRHKHYRDSLDQVIRLKNDSLEIAFTTIRIQAERILSTEQQVIKLQKRHENIHFITHRTDSARVRSLSELYSSYGKD